MGLSFTQVLALIALPFIAQILTAAESPPAGSANTQPTFDATLLKEGRYTYRMTMQGKSLGDSVIEIRHGGSTYRLTMDAIEIGQSWQASVDTSFAPLAAHLVMESRDVPYEMTLSYDGRKVSGEERSNGVATPISATSKGVVIDQRVDWASMMAVQATAGNSVTMNVFDPATGFSPLVGRVQATPAMSGVWGTTDVMRLDYSICKLDRVEHYTVFATTSTPRYMLREDMPNGLVTELIRIEP